MTITRFKLPVTQEHINHGDCKMVGRRAVALALADLFGGTGRDVVPSVSDDSARVNMCYSLTPVERGAWKAFVLHFDEGRPIPPTTFVLEGHNLPEWMLARIKEREALC